MYIFYKKDCVYFIHKFTGNFVGKADLCKYFCSLLYVLTFNM